MLSVLKGFVIEHEVGGYKRHYIEDLHLSVEH